MQEPIDLVVITEEKRKAGGLSLSTLVSLTFHAALIFWFVNSYRPIEQSTGGDAPIPRYIELMKQNPQDFIEAPGPEIDKAPLSAPLSDKNRKASMPEPTGLTPTKRPGDGGGLYNPPANPAPRGPQPSPSTPAIAQAPQPATQPAAPSTQQQPITTTSNETFIYREPVKASAGLTNLSKVINEIGRQGARGGGDGFDLGALTGGEQGTAEQGPLSFETAWYNWGDYAASMVSKIRVNWYANMPQIIRTGMKGVVTIRFTIHRDGRISDVQTINSSTVPPYDLAARKAIELSSPLRPLPADFPNASERVTCMFYYNMEVPRN